MKRSRIIVGFCFLVLFFLWSSSFALADQSELQIKKDTERGLSEMIEFNEKKINTLQEDIKKWEFQLTGLRRFLYPEGYVRNIVRGWIRDYKAELSRKKKEQAGLKESRERLLARIVELETAELSGFPISQITIKGYAPGAGANSKSLTWNGTFTRVGTENKYDAVRTGGNLGGKQHKEQGLSITTYRPREEIVIHRPGLGDYTGKYENGKWKGGASWYGTGRYWTATISE